MSHHKMKLLLSAIIIFLLLQAFAEASLFEDTHDMDSLTNVKDGGDAAALYKKHYHPKINCKFACARRCKKASRKNVCTRACGTCCMRCQCVPPGTYGNKSVCPCYASLKTHGHKPKCP